MRYYDVYRTKEGEAVAIKHGICWPAMFLSWIWLARKKMWYGATLHFLLQAIIYYFVVYAISKDLPDNNIKNIYMSYMYTALYEALMIMILFYVTILLGLSELLIYSMLYAIGVDALNIEDETIFEFGFNFIITAVICGILIFIVLTLLYSFEFAYGRSVSRKGGKRLRRRLRAKSRNDAIDIALAEEGNTLASDPDADFGTPNR